MSLSEKSNDVESKATSSSEIQTRQDPVPSPPPEGGFWGWSTLAGACLVQFATFGYTNAFGVYQGPKIDFYVRSYLTKYTPSQIGWIGGIQLFLIFAVGIVTGRAFDRGYFHHMMIGGALLHIFSFFMLSLSHDNSYYQVFLSQGLGGGLACGIVYIPSLAVVSHYFQRHRPLAMGIVAAGTALGAVLHPLMLNNLFHGPIGFRNGVRISTAMNAGLLIIANLMMRTRLPPKKTGSKVPIAEFARDLPYLFVLLGGMLLVCGLFFPIFFLQLNAVTHGVDPKFAFYCLSIMNAASIFGRTIPAIFVPRYGVFNLIIFFTFSMAAIIYCLAAVKDAAGVVVFAIFFGFFSGGGITLLPSMLAYLAKDVGEIGARIGIVFAFSGIAGLFAVPISGALLTTHQFLWWRPIVFAGTTMVGCATLFSLSRFILARRKGTQWL